MKKKSQTRLSYQISFFLVFLIEIFLIGLSYGAIDINDLYEPTLNTGDKLAFDSESKDSPYSPPSCIKIEYNEKDIGYGTMIWRYPQDNTGERNGRTLTGVKRLVFHARSKDPMDVSFAVGAFKQDTAYKKQTEKLGPKWKQYTIDLSDQNLRNVRGGFSCTLNSTGVVYLDDINYER